MATEANIYWTSCSASVLRLHEELGKFEGKFGCLMQEEEHILNVAKITEYLFSQCSSIRIDDGITSAGAGDSVNE